MRESTTTFIRNKKGKVVKVIKTGDDASLEAKMKEYKQKERQQKQKKRAKRKKKAHAVIKKAKKEMNTIRKNIDNANDWLTKQNW